MAHLYNNFVSAYGQLGNDDESAGQEFGGDACCITAVNYGSIGEVLLVPQQRSAPPTRSCIRAS
ncbi:MAG: hypothetical protein ABIQ73_24495 [Acidimicrobiales bacterium]